MDTIQAKVSKRLLSKADRLFTGTLDGRIIEILQNARRAGATEVTVTNEKGLVTVRDNGCGIEDFSKLLDLGDSDWDEALEKAEDPAGVGVFCLAPRKVAISSKAKKVIIGKDGWTGKPVEIVKVDDPINGTVLTFADEPWELSVVKRHAVFSGMTVVVDGKTCPQEPFSSSRAVPHPELGCKIEVREGDHLNQWHNQWRDHYFCDTVMVNFHGQVIKFTYNPVTENLVFLVDMTGEPTGIRMMLPARTRMIENKAFEAMKAAIEKEAYRFIQKRGKHKLPYEQYKRAAELGIKLPEAEPTFNVGVLSGDTPEPIEVVMPKEFPLSKCYRISERLYEEDEKCQVNAHLLAALGQFNEPFVPVDISRSYDGYSWARLPTVDKVQVRLGKELGRGRLWSEVLVAVESIRITAHTSDGKVFESNVLMAVLEPGRAERPWRGADHVYVTPKAREQLASSHIWYHLGGWCEDGDTYDTQEYQFGEELELFWSDIVGPGEYLRAKIVGNLDGIKGEWQTITIDAHRTVVITYKNGSTKTLKSPFAEDGAA
jgi:hypothetical protein